MLLTEKMARDPFGLQRKATYVHTYEEKNSSTYIFCIFFQWYRFNFLFLKNKNLEFDLGYWKNYVQKNML